MSKRTSNQRLFYHRPALLLAWNVLTEAAVGSDHGNIDVSAMVIGAIFVGGGLILLTCYVLFSVRHNRDAEKDRREVYRFRHGLPRQGKVSRYCQ